MAHVINRQEPGPLLWATRLHCLEGHLEQWQLWTPGDTQLVVVSHSEMAHIEPSGQLVRWRLADLAQWIWDEFALSVTRHTLGRELRGMGYRKLTARPRHRGQKGDDIADFKKASPPVWRRSSSGSREELR